MTEPNLPVSTTTQYDSFNLLFILYYNCPLKYCDFKPIYLDTWEGTVDRPFMTCTINVM